ncbi:MAG: iron donor protein CyaY [Alphaproteobacteria bacterium]|nr:iron donor protein CyaY [Alphaproteobacteria bacterium]
MNESDFETLADRLLDALETALADAGLDAERSGGVLTIEADQGIWIVNKHAPTRQIWLSSPLSGARHFAWDEGTRRWTDTRGRADLLPILADELGARIDGMPA